MKNIVYSIIIMGLWCTGCKKFVDPGDPSTQLVKTTVFANDANATSAMVGIYAAMESDGLEFQLALAAGLSADELINYGSSADYVDLGANNLTPDNAVVQQLWSLLYKYNYQANAVLEGTAGSVKLSSSVKQLLQGEAYFVRAFCHYYLTSFFGEIPVIVTTNYLENAIAGRQPQSAVYNQIAADLQKSIELLPTFYVDGNNQETMERVRPNKYTALALLARVQLEQSNWSAAEQSATEIISQNGLYSMGLLEDVFNKESSEAIWQLMAVVPGNNSFSATQFILTGPPSIAALTDTLVRSFESGDNRKTDWVGELDAGQLFYFPFKYKVNANAPSVTEYTVLFRLAELHLIRAEARANQNRLSEAVDDINLIRERAGLSYINPFTKEDVLTAIRQERKIELFTENAHRWIDLRRWNLADLILAPIKSPNWQPFDQLYPVPQNERNKNPNLTQNAGY